MVVMVAKGGPTLMKSDNVLDIEEDTDSLLTVTTLP